MNSMSLHIEKLLIKLQNNLHELFVKHLKRFACMANYLAKVIHVWLEVDMHLVMQICFFLALL